MCTDTAAHLSEKATIHPTASFLLLISASAAICHSAKFAGTRNAQLAIGIE